MGIISSKQFLKLITNYLIFISFHSQLRSLLNITLSMNSYYWLYFLLSSSSSFSVSELAYCFQMRKLYPLGHPDLKIFLYAFFSIFSKSNDKKPTIIFSRHCYLILIPTVIILVPELITSQQDYFNNFLDVLSRSCFCPLQCFLHTTAFFTQFIFPSQNLSRFPHN